MHFSAPLKLLTACLSTAVFANIAINYAENDDNKQQVTNNKQIADNATKSEKINQQSANQPNALQQFLNYFSENKSSVTQNNAQSNTQNTAIYPHNLSFDNDPKSRQIRIADKTYGDKTDAIFRDGFGREALFRGWNVSGAVKLKSMNYMPFKNAHDASQSFGAMGKQMGANQIRFTIAWEGIHKAPDEIDYDYLNKITAQMREAIKHRMYIVLDWHSDLYTRYTFNKNSLDTGNGAPEWIVKAGNHGYDMCGLPCLFSWGGHKLFDPATRSAYRDFWLNSPIETTKGTRHVQDEFLWQMGKVAKYLNENLTAEERDYILGFEPLNEPFDAGVMKEQSDFDNKILWPFYKRVRATMDKNGFSDKLVYAEPNVFWYTTTGVVAPATGYGYLKEKVGKRFVFTPHLYDQGRMGIDEMRWADNATYTHKLDEVRKEARRLGTPIMMSEYGMWNPGKGRQDTLRIINGTIQALETSNGQETIVEKNQKVETKNASRFADFYTPFVSGTQWHWNHYYDKNAEYLNDNPNKLITKADGWNKEDFSVVKEYSSQYTHAPEVTERSYPRRTQGDLMHFAYNAQVTDKSGNKLNWQSIRVDLANEFTNREYFRNRKFAIAVWRGRKANAPTEIYLPASFKPNLTTVITEKVIKQGLNVSNKTANTANEVLLTKDIDQWSGSGNRLLVWDDVDNGENADNSIHYALIVEHSEDMSKTDLQALQQALTQRIIKEQKSAVYLPSKMTFNGYPKDFGAKSHFQLIEQRNNYCLDVSSGLAKDGQKVQTFPCNQSKAQGWQYQASTGNIISQLNPNKCLTVKGQVKKGAELELRTCDKGLNARQQFIKKGNWNWGLKSQPNLQIDSFGKFAGTVGLWSDHDNANQQWVVRY